MTSGMVMTAGLSWGGARAWWCGIFEVRGEGGIVVGGCGEAVAAGEDVVDLAGHVEGGEQCAECAHVEREPARCSSCARRGGWRPSTRSRRRRAGIRRARACRPRR